MLAAVDRWIRWAVERLTDLLPVKVIRDERGTPFLYRYHLFALTDDGPGMCIHHFVKSDPDRGYHDHPWNSAVSLILSGGYQERFPTDAGYRSLERRSWRLNVLDGTARHRVMLADGQDAWTVFAFGRRAKLWSMHGMDGIVRTMSTSISDQDGGWWNHAPKGLGVHAHLPLHGLVVATVDVVVVAAGRVLLIRRGKEPFKQQWALPGGRVEESDPDLRAAAARELQQETGLVGLDLEYVETVGNNERDPRGFCVTSVFRARLDAAPATVRAGDDAVDFQWAELDLLPDLAFDHAGIVARAE